jgi:hypothetical protein
LAVEAVALVVVVLVVASVVVVALEGVAVVTALALVRSLAQVAEVVAIAQATISSLAQVILAQLATHDLLAAIVSLTHAPPALVTHVLLVPPIHVLLALVTHAHLLAHVLLNRKLAANVEALAVTKYGSPSSPPFCMESSRFR